jgi:predicted metal-dependent hydrolase
LTKDQPHIDRILRSRRKSFSIQIDETGTLIVRAPWNATDRTIYEIVARKRAWIEKKLHTARERSRRIQNRSFKEGDRYLYLGEWFPLSINHIPQTGIHFQLERGRFQLDLNERHRARDLMIEWYRIQAKHVLAEQAVRYACSTGLSYRKINITGAQKRWGSCSCSGNLNFSWRLVMAPVEVIAYVVVHELVHLREQNHSPRFWKLVSDFLPEYRSRRSWLNEKGYLLNL